MIRVGMRVAAREFSPTPNHPTGRLINTLLDHARQASHEWTPRLNVQPKGGVIAVLKSPDRNDYA